MATPGRRDNRRRLPGLAPTLSKSRRTGASRGAGTTPSFLPTVAALGSILVHLDATACAEVRLRIAHELAAAHRARLDVLFAVSPPRLSLAWSEIGLDAHRLALHLHRHARQRARTLAAFERLQGTGVPAASWTHAWHEPVVAAVARRAWLSDLVVLGQHDPRDAAAADLPEGFVEAVLTESGRPVLIIPRHGLVVARPARVLIAWRETRATAQALVAALPFMRQASEILLVGTWPATPHDPPRPGLDIESFLKLHGVTIDHRHPPLRAALTGDDLLQVAHDVAAQLIVMGCSERERLRRLACDEATRTVLTRARTVVLAMR